MNENPGKPDAPYEADLYSHRRAIESLKRGLGWWLALLIVGVAAYSVTRWRTEEVRNLRQFASIVDVGANSLDTYFSQFRSAFLVLSRHLENHDIRSGDPNVKSILNDYISAYPDLGNISVFSLDGSLLVSAMPTDRSAPRAINDFSDFAHFRDVVARERDFEISRPLYSPMLKDWIVALRYAVRDAHGDMRYLLGAALPLSRTQAFWKTLALPEGGALALLRDDGYLVSRHPIPEKASLEDVYARPRKGTLASIVKAGASAERGYLEGQASMPGVSPSLVFVYARLPHYPVTFVMTIPTRNFIVWWWEVVRFQYLVILAVGAGSFLLYRWILKRQTEWVYQTEATHRHLEKASRTDPLTGTLNRRAAMEELKRELSRAVRDGRPAALITFDLDHFKSINDRHGHAAGDKALQMFVRTVRELIRPYDVLARFGGEEFVLMMPNTNGERAVVAAERIRATLERRQTGRATPLTVSAGVADSLEKDVDGDLERLLAVSDARLYEAKRSRNTVVGPP